MPDPSIVSEFSEPWVLGTIITPSEYMGEIMSICMDRRGQQKNSTFLDDKRVLMQFYMPLSEVIVDFFDILKSKTSGYASFDYEDAGYRPIHLVKVRKRDMFRDRKISKITEKRNAEFLNVQCTE